VNERCSRRAKIRRQYFFGSGKILPVPDIGVEAFDDDSAIGHAVSSYSASNFAA
jgi:hypothetical protein